MLNEIETEVKLVLRHVKDVLHLPIEYHGPAKIDVMGGASDLSYLYTPFRFHYTCNDAIEIPLKVTNPPVTFKEVKGGDDTIIIENPVITMFLVFHNVKLEAFRLHGRYSDHFTHLKWDCRTHSVYKTIPMIIRIFLPIFASLFFITIALRIK